MILLDTNYLIRCLVKDTIESQRITQWIVEGEQFCTSSICWYEFLSGPVDQIGVDLVRALVQGPILCLSQDTAQRAAEMWNRLGRPKSLRIDTLIAAQAIDFEASLAITNRADFIRFLPFGLTLATSDTSQG